MADLFTQVGGWVGIFIICLALVIAAYYVKGIPKGLGKWLKVGGVAGLVISGAYVFGVMAMIEPAAITPVDETTYDVTATESADNLTYDDVTKTFTMTLGFNDTSDAFVGNTQYLVANFTISWAGGPVEVDGVAMCDVGNVAIIDVTGAADEYIVDESTNGVYSVLWAKSGGFSHYEDISVLVAYGSSAWVTVNVTLNAAAVAAMATDEIADFQLVVGGEIFTVHALKDNVVT